MFLLFWNKRIYITIEKSWIFNIFGILFLNFIIMHKISIVSNFYENRLKIVEIMTKNLISIVYKTIENKIKQRKNIEFVWVFLNIFLFVSAHKYKWVFVNICEINQYFRPPCLYLYKNNNINNRTIEIKYIF